jgi:hypothetical protein
VAQTWRKIAEAVGGRANDKGKKTSRKYGNKHGAGYSIKALQGD